MGIVPPPEPYVQHYRDMEREEAKAKKASDADSRIAELEAKNTALDVALTEICDERDKYHEDYMRLRGADKALMDGMQRECADAHNRLTTAEGLLLTVRDRFKFEANSDGGVVARLDAFLKRSE